MCPVLQKWRRKISIVLQFRNELSCMVCWSNVACCFLQLIFRFMLPFKCFCVNSGAFSYIKHLNMFWMLKIHRSNISVICYLKKKPYRFFPSSEKNPNHHAQLVQLFLTWKDPNLLNVSIRGNLVMDSITPVFQWFSKNWSEPTKDSIYNVSLLVLKSKSAVCEFGWDYSTLPSET